MCARLDSSSSVQGRRNRSRTLQRALDSRAWCASFHPSAWRQFRCSALLSCPSRFNRHPSIAARQREQRGEESGCCSRAWPPPTPRPACGECRPNWVVGPPASERAVRTPSLLSARCGPEAARAAWVVSGCSDRAAPAPPPPLQAPPLICRRRRTGAAATATGAQGGRTHHRGHRHVRPSLVMQCEGLDDGQLRCLLASRRPA